MSPYEIERGLAYTNENRQVLDSVLPFLVEDLLTRQEEGAPFCRIMPPTGGADYDPGLCTS